GRLVGDTHFDGLLDHSVTFPLLPGDLGPDGATVTVRALLDPGVSQGFFYVDGFEVEHRRFLRAEDGVDLAGEWPAGAPSLTVEGFTGNDLEVLDTTDPDQPRRLGDALIEGPLAGGTYRTSFGQPGGAGSFLVARRSGASRPAIVPDRPSSLRSPANAAAYVVITSEALAPAAQALADLRTATLGSAMVVRIEDVMDEWNGGRLHPLAIRDFLTHAHQTWLVPPTHVALVGRGHSDYRDILGVGLPAVAGPMLGTPFGLYSGDAVLGDVNGDGAAEIAVGRVPVSSSAELERYVQKLGRYESGAHAYSQNVLLVADNPDAGGEFDADMQDLEASLPTGLAVTRIELAGDPLAARQLLLQGLESGAGWTSWAGHGAIDRMGDEGVLVTTDAPGLANAGRPTLLTAFSCNIARYELPGFTSLAEELVVAEGGAVAVWAPSGLTLHPDSLAAQRLLAGAAFTGEHRTLGELLLTVGRGFSKEALLASDHEVYQLIGDPALELHFPALAGNNALFADGFETADTARWSQATGPGQGNPP
ncbi:MAG: C25 family cysteine peptidase, partial [Holophagales bacterium]|nr:C25 family cysteine peptidase [Holophagales bacterium]